MSHLESKRTRRRILLALALLALALGSLTLLDREDAPDRRSAAPSGGRAPGSAARSPARPDPRAEPDREAVGDEPHDDPAGLPSGPAPAASTAPALTPAQLREALARGEPGFEVLASRLPEERAAVTARWSVGDEWLVETWYRQMQAPGDPWSGPALWRYRVEREVPVGGVPCLELVVTRADEPAWPATVVHVARDASRVVQVEATVTEQGKERRLVHTPADRGPDAPLAADLLLAPFELPPPCAAARVAPPGLPFDRRSANARAGAPLPEPAQLLGAGQPGLDLEFAHPRDGTPVRQRWSQDDLRWPVVSRTETTLSFRRRT